MRLREALLRLLVEDIGLERVEGEEKLAEKKVRAGGDVWWTRGAVADEVVTLAQLREFEWTREQKEIGMSFGNMEISRTDPASIRKPMTWSSQANEFRLMLLSKKPAKILEKDIFSRLVDLNLENCGIQSLGSDLTHFSGLKVLNVCRNELTEVHCLPAAVVVLLAHGNKIHTATINLDRNHKLRYIGMAYNRLSNIQFEGLVQSGASILALDLSFNRFTELNQLDSVLKLSTLQTLNILGNPLSLNPKVFQHVIPHLSALKIYNEETVPMGTEETQEKTENYETPEELESGTVNFLCYIEEITLRFTMELQSDKKQLKIPPIKAKVVVKAVHSTVEEDDFQTAVDLQFPDLSEDDSVEQEQITTDITLKPDFRVKGALPLTTDDVRKFDVEGFSFTIGVIVIGDEQCNEEAAESRETPCELKLVLPVLNILYKQSILPRANIEGDVSNNISINLKHATDKTNVEMSLSCTTGYINVQGLPSETTKEALDKDKTYSRTSDHVNHSISCTVVACQHKTQVD